MIFRALGLAVYFVVVSVGPVTSQALAPEGVEQFTAPEEVTGSGIAGIDLNEWQAFATLAEGIVEPGTATRFALTRVRAELVPWRDAFFDANDANQARLATVARQITALTPTNETAETDPLIAERLADLNALHARLEQPQLLAREAYARADGLIGEIDKQVRYVETQRLAMRGVSPANPKYWPDALKYLGSGVTEGVTEIYATTKVFVADGRLLSRSVTVLFALIFATLFVFRVSYWLGVLANRDLGGTARFRAVAKFLISISRVILPVIGLMVLTGILTRSGFFGLTGLAVIAVLPTAGALVFYPKWLTDQYYPRHPDNDGILGYDHPTRVSGRRYAVLLGWTLAFSVLIDALASTTRASSVSLDVINLPFQLAVGWFLWRLGSYIVHKAQPNTTAIFTRNRVRQIIGRAAQVFAIAGPFASLLGFGAAAQAITIPAVVTLAIIATIVVLQRLSFDVMSRAVIISEPTIERTQESLLERSGLLPIVVNLVVVLLSLPVIAVVWGASAADLAEVWTRFLAGFSVGGTKVSPTSFLTFVTVFAVGYILTGFAKTSLKASVLPRTQLDLGGQNAIVAGTGYLGIFLSALIGFSVAGIDLSSLAIVAGALSVGIGFGLQNIVSNFVSGIILLIERPVSEGDMIEVGGQMGYVREISVRSTRIETFDKIDVIIPNADLVSGQVSNWTRGNLVGRAIVAVGVAYGTDTTKVARILQEIAEANPIVVLNPPPTVLLIQFGADSVDFEIRAIIRDVNFVNIAKSEMFHEVIRRFAEEGIEIPFAQRDIWLRNPEALHPKGEAS